jgi:anti-sigma factor RsiW
MCDFAEKLTAWLDGELAAAEAAEIERHLQLCTECHERLEAYRRAVSAFDSYSAAYADAVLESPSERKLPRPVLAVWAAGALAAVMATLLLLTPPPQVPAASTRTAPGMMSAPIADEPVSATQMAQAQDSNFPPSGLALEIAIPGDDMAPPGAFPEGVGFTADVMLAPDGSAQQIRIRPQLTEFERRPNRP